MNKKQNEVQETTWDIPNLLLKMKITVFLFFSILLNVTAEVTAQRKTVTLDLENVTLQEAFTTLEKKTGYNLLYNNKHVNLERRVSIRVNNEQVKNVLGILFKNTNLSYVILDKQIILKLKSDSLDSKSVVASKVLGSSTSKALQQKVKGTVLDNKGIPLTGVTVLVKGTQRGVVTDFDGNYEIEVAPGEILTFSYLGFLTKEVTVNEDIEINVSLQPSTIELNSVEIVSTGYQKLPKERVTGSFENVSKDLLDRKAASSIIDKISGEVTGVQFNPGDERNPIIIRGLSSINSNTQPLVVVDGFPIQGGFNTINLNEVESVSVLKDAAAASIWGIRATNGVIVIVTKKGTNNSKPQFTASITNFYSPKPNLFQNNIADPATQIDYTQQLFNTGLIFQNRPFQPGDAFINSSTSSQVAPIIRVLQRLRDGNITQAQADEQLATLSGIDSRDEYSRLILRPTLNSQYNLTASGGGEQSDYRISLLYNRQEEEYIGVNSDQILANINNNLQLTKKLSLRTNLNASFSNADLFPSDGSALSEGFVPFINGFRSLDASSFITSIPLSSNILNSDGSYAPMIGGSGQALSDFLEARNFEPLTYNAKQEFDNNNNTSKSVDLRLQTALNYEINDALNIEALYQYEANWSRNANILNRNRYITRAMFNYFAEIPGGSANNPGAIEILSQPIARGGIAQFDETNITGHTFRTQLNYDKSFNNGVHQLNALAGYEARKTIAEVRQTIRYGYNEQALTYVNPDYNSNFSLPLFSVGFLETIPDGSTYVFDENRFISYFANIGYTYDNRYTFTASTRLDDTNLFGQSDEFRNVPLYSFGLKWNVTNEDFFKVDFINKLSLRATYGTNGNVNLTTSPFLLQGLANSTRNDFPNHPFGFVSSVPNPTLRLERTKTTNLGIDIGLFNGLIDATIEAYRADSEDLLSGSTLNPTLGVERSVLNIGTLRNEGIDIGVTLNAIRSEDLTFSTRFNYSYNRNLLTDVESDVQADLQGFLLGVDFINQRGDLPNYLPIQGLALGTLHAFRFAGLDSQGRVQFFDENGEVVDYTVGISNPDAYRAMGTTIAPHYGSLMTNFRYKGFGLRTLTSFQAGHVFRNFDVYDPRGMFEDPTLTFTDYNQRWQQPGDELNPNTLPALVLDAATANAPGYFGDETSSQYLYSDLFVDTASTITLQEIIVSYSFSKNTLKSLGLNDFTISLQGNNLKVWNFNKWDVNPNSTTIPIRPVYTFGIRTSF